DPWPPWSRCRCGCGAAGTLYVMCGIVGYVGHRGALDVVLGGFRRLEYRGRDSAGVALRHGAEVVSAKEARKMANRGAGLAAPPLPDSAIGIGHTRWATHGQPNDVNAHPHLDAERRIAVVHNGIIENFFQLRESLAEKGYEFVSQTDTETVAHLVHAQLKDSRDLPEAVRAVCRQLEGAFTIVVVDAQDPDVVVGARRNS